MSEVVLLLLVAIRNPRWWLWSLIALEIFYFFFRTTAYEVTNLARNMPQKVVSKCCYFSDELLLKLYYVLSQLNSVETLAYIGA
jgi:hypothetical protein